jgi:hypothetical protein
MSAVVTYRAESGLWSAAIPGVSIICHAVAEDACRAAIVSTVEGVDVDAAMASPVGPDEWRSAAAASVAGALNELRADVDQLSDGALAQAMTTKIEFVEGILREVHAELTEANRLQAEANANKAKANALLEQQQQRIEADRAAKAQADNAARWVDVQVVQNSDGSVEMLRHVCEFAAFIGPKREPEFRRYAIRVGKWASADVAPADIRARIGKPFGRSKPEVPER